MAEVKWIKIATDIFDDEKILLIESLPDAYAIITVWFKLLCLAGKKNNGGVFLMNDKIPYTDKMLATIFRMNESTVKLALNAFEQFKMIEIVEGIITIPNWNKHQTLDAYERKKERDRLYQEERRAKQRALIEKSSDKSSERTSDVAVSDIDKDIDIDKERDIDNIYDCAEAQKPQKKMKREKPMKHKYGEYNNVLLTGDELCKLKDKFPDWEDRIERLSGYIESKGAKYKSHYATILNWARREGNAGRTAIKSSMPKNTGYAPEQDMNDLDDLF
ncbi:phage replisome organizer N-terminal domain-containing protein [Mediterraneibacter gnavus]|uniref:phage replisome organizer N-terminal domain-containing protein n=1 Tax=Mediterraneibacter gnavus TaxID=33038 RepID=UPI0023310374|nr:phage replisome organizer N-terminal domain-containing protein [Mediterraneibacter gnavus]MDB8711653.1 phage replisome organizer N-terminal domain-containing protein [Mediterraneibacter gnavus]MDB8714663.1 phage replisome organizer N-terminal domain-containing protein [Mediterraneibacter gnavus]